MTSSILVGVLALSVLCSISMAAPQWRPAVGSIDTPWASQVDPANPLPEYPRPQLVRVTWQNLNGLWDYAVANADQPMPQTFDGKILVPFPIESSLSGVRRTISASQRLWYRRTFATPGRSAHERVILHFGAVDYDTRVRVNGREVGAHVGGYDSFGFDITDALREGSEPNELVVDVLDPTEAGPQPRGKQHLASVEKPGGIWYTPCSGIWQTVWMEVVPAVSIEHLKLTGDIDRGALRIETEIRGDPLGCTLHVEARAAGDSAGTASGPVGGPLEVRLNPLRLWSPDDPFLYDLKLTVRRGDQVIDEVMSYAGMRKIAAIKDQRGRVSIQLNNRDIFQAGPLDQGYWPDGIYTAPTDDALRYDIEITRRFGFNMARKHIKVEPARWYYWADKLGLLVWQDMPSGTADGGTRTSEGKARSPEAAAQFERELRAMIRQCSSHPSIVMWVVFNEGWGQHDTQRLTTLTRSLDPTRLVNNASGWVDMGVGDVHDIHNYPSPACPPQDGRRAPVLGEFGGLAWAQPGHLWVEQTWGYRQYHSQRVYASRFFELWREVDRLRREQGLCAAVYTQTTDVETECNGLLTYDRKSIKIEPERVADAVKRAKFPPAPTRTALAPTAREQQVQWTYTTTEPAPQWTERDFDDTGWRRGLGGLGTAGTPGAIVGTTWDTPHIWARSYVKLPGPVDAKQLMLCVHHDEEAEIYINGILAARLRGFTKDYDLVEPAPEAAESLRAGDNVIAVHCRQTRGGQYIDVGLLLEQ